MQPRLARTLTISSDESLAGPPLDVLADVWSRRRSGWLRVGLRRAAICGGGILDAHGAELVEQALTSDDGAGQQALSLAADIRFDPADHAGLADTYTVALALWDAALKEADPSFVDRVLHRALASNDFTPLCAELPLSVGLKGLLTAGGERPLKAALAEAWDTAPRLRQELAALARLGLVRFQRLQPPRAVPPEAGEVIQPGLGHRRADTQDPEVEYTLLIARLRREVAALRGADDWSLLGVPRSAPPDRVHAAGERALRRCRDLADDPRLPGEARGLAQTLLAHTEEAVDRLTLYAEDATDDGRGLEAFRLGRAAMDQGRIQDAVRHFTAACERSPNAVRNQAWLGWALFWDESRPRGPRRQEAIDRLTRADDLNADGADADAAYFLAHAMADFGEYGAAERRLSRLLHRHPDHKRARRLFLTVRRQRSGRG